MGRVVIVVVVVYYVMPKEILTNETGSIRINFDPYHRLTPSVGDVVRDCDYDVVIAVSVSVVVVAVAVGTLML